jgi:hypothetical protein
MLLIMMFSLYRFSYISFVFSSRFLDHNKHIYVCGDHLQTCQVKSAASQVHDWVVYRSGGILGSVGHKVKIHKITPSTGRERGDLEIQDYVVLQKPQKQADRLLLVP